MKTPINVQEIWKFAPHRPPMVWVDQIVKFGENGGETSVSIKPNALYMEKPDVLRSSSCLEFIAQSYGFISICHREFSGDPVNETPKRAFLAAFNDAKFADPARFTGFAPGESLRVEVSGARAMGPIILFSGKVFRGDTLLCESRMKVFSEE